MLAHVPRRGEQVRVIAQPRQLDQHGQIDTGDHFDALTEKRQRQVRRRSAEHVGHDEHALPLFDAGNRAGNLLMIIDACNSGQALEAEEKRRGPMNSRGLAQLAYEKGMMTLTASQSQQAALETSRLGHGLLTYSLVQGLKNADRTAENAIIDRNWFNYASTLVPQLQLDEMQKRDVEVKSGKRDIGVNFGADEDKNLSPEKRALQSPRLFYRREADVNPFVVAKP